MSREAHVRFCESAGVKFPRATLHLVFRSRGGGNERANRITLCAWHHLRGVHAGRVRAEGEAPQAVTWEIGRRPGRVPLLRLVGEQYASA
jgi:hypothetical protein